MESPIITLTTDWNLYDFFVGKVKGRLLRYIPDARIVDITHTLGPFQLTRAIFIARNACGEYPEETVHIIDVSAPQSAPGIVPRPNGAGREQERSQRRDLVVMCEGQYYICEDNGLPYALFSGREYKAYDTTKVTWESKEVRTFPGLDLYCKLASMLVKGFGLEEVGSPVDNLHSIATFDCVPFGDDVAAHVTHFDSYGNAYLDIPYETFENIRQGRAFTVHVSEFTITKIQFDYAPSNTPLILVVSVTGYLQVAIVGHSAEQLLGLRNNSTIHIHFGEEPKRAPLVKKERVTAVEV